MNLILNSFQKSVVVFVMMILVWVVLHGVIYFIPVDLSLEFHSSIDDTYFFIEFAPEIWLTLLGIILGTLIIVISIASQSNPKLIDYYLGDYPSLYYIWGITMGGIENIYMQLNLAINSIYWNNVIFMNVYLTLPLAIVGGIPYTFYILSYTKTSNVISKIFQENKKFIDRFVAAHDNPKNIRDYQHYLLDTINQLDDQLGYVQFKEAKSEIINRFGRSMRSFLKVKHKIEPGFFMISSGIHHDISFKTLRESFNQIEGDKTFYEHKIFRIMVGIYRDFIEKGHYDLASHCGNELAKIGITALENKQRKSVDLLLIQFNTILRIGIKQATKTSDIRGVYSSVYHYSYLINEFIKAGQNEYVLKCCRYFTYYVKELQKLSKGRPHFRFLVDALNKELQVILIRLNENNREVEFQQKILKIFADHQPDGVYHANMNELKGDGSRLIQIALILYYLEKDSEHLAHYLLGRMIDYLIGIKELSKNNIVQIVVEDCKRIKDTAATFWEDTDRGNTNIYHAPEKHQITNFVKLFHEKIGNYKEALNGRLAMEAKELTSNF